MEILKMALSIILVIDCIICAGIVLMQEGKSAGLGTISGVADTYWGKNKGRSGDGLLKRITLICTIVFFVLAIVLNLKVFN